MGIDLSEHKFDYDEQEITYDPLTGDTAALAALAKVKASIEASNAYLSEKEVEINARLRTAAAEITAAFKELQHAHGNIEAALAVKVTALQQQGLQVNIQELNKLIQQKGTVMASIAKITGEAVQLKKLRADRKQYLQDLTTVREEITNCRKGQLKTINHNLANTIEDYSVFLKYEPSGIIDKFKDYLLENMQGTYFQEETAASVCSRITPGALATMVLNRNATGIASTCNIDVTWGSKICDKLCYWAILHELEAMWKAPCPVSKRSM